MQDRYVGDVGDLGKMGLLRWLSGLTDPESPDPRLKVGLVWYWHYDEKHPPGNKKKMSADGRHISYLRRTARDDKTEYRDPDPELWESLRDLVYRDGRCVHCAENAGLLPKDTAYCSDQLAYTAGMKRKLKEQVRASWLAGAVKAMTGADIVCVDPDNGIAKEDKMFSRDGSKFTYISDLHQFWGKHQSLFIYQHMPMDRAARGRSLEIGAELQGGLGWKPSPCCSQGVQAGYFS